MLVAFAHVVSVFIVDADVDDVSSAVGDVLIVDSFDGVVVVVVLGGEVLWGVTVLSPDFVLEGEDFELELLDGVVA